MLLPTVAADAERLARLTREAQVLASLNHPHIAAIYGLEDSAGIPALVLELVEGPTLADRIALGPMPLDEALPIARQIAEALEAAHEQGIIHRDLKPANIKVRPDGTVKVLDFGLAKALEPVASSNVNVTQSPTITSPAMLTSVGVILGTAAYMAPEQVAGKPADKRSDLWAFGVVLLEMLTGRSVFTGETVSHVLAAVLKSEPDWTTLPKETPAAIQRLLRRCLEKERKRRLDSAADARLEIDDVLTGAASGLTPAPAVAIARPLSWRRILPLAAAVSLGLIVGGASVRALLRPVPREIVRLTANHSGEVGDSYPASDVAISPDGRRIVYTTGVSMLDKQQLFVRDLDQLDATLLPGINAANPFVSPDGQWVGYVEGPYPGGTMKRVRINGGPPVTICIYATGINGASWGPDERIVFSTRPGNTGGLFRVAAGGGEPEALTKPDSSKGELAHGAPEVLPGGRALLFTIVPTPNTGATHQIAVLDLTTGRTKMLISEGTSPRYASSGHLVYAAAGSLRAVPFDVSRLELRGDPVTLVERVATKQPPGSYASFAIAQDGTLIHRTGDAQAAANRILVWVDRNGHEEPIGAPVRAYNHARLSPDGTRIALDIRDQENDIWVWDFARPGLRRFTFDPGVNRGVAWSPDSKRIAFSTQRDGAENLYWQAADGTGTAERLTDRPKPQFPSSFTPDGTRLLFSEPFPNATDIGVVNVTGDRRAELLPRREHENAGHPDISPDGRWLAYESFDSKQVEIYVSPFPNVDGGRWRVSTGVGWGPVWARNGHELFYYQPPGKIYAVPVRLAPTFVSGTPQVVVDGRYGPPAQGRSYDVSSDGQRFLMIKDAPSAASQLVVVQNFFEELKRLVPTK